MVNIQHALQYAKNCFADGSDTPLFDAELLLAHQLSCERSVLHAWPEREISINDWQQYQILCAERAQGKPIAYLLGTQAFWKFNLHVTPDVLIPRPETELLVETALQLFSSHEKIQAVDLGTGSGAIALALAYEKPAWNITGTDKSIVALQVAQKNAAQLGIDTIKWLQSDWFSELKNQKFDLIISNPPYIDPVDPHLAALRYEPASALIAENQGAADLEYLIQTAIEYLLPEGYLVLEHGYQQAEIVRERMRNVGFIGIKTETDLLGHPRMTWGSVL